MWTKVCDGFLIDDAARVTDFSCGQVEGECPSLDLFCSMSLLCGLQRGSAVTFFLCHDKSSSLRSPAHGCPLLSCILSGSLSAPFPSCSSILTPFLALPCGGLLCLLPTSPYAPGSNASGFAVVAFSASALHQPPRELPASSLQAGAEKAVAAKLEALEPGA